MELKSVGNWVARPSNEILTQGNLLGELELSNGEHFTIVQTPLYLVFGGACNTGLLESGNYVMDLDLSIDENLYNLLEDLESYYKGESVSDCFACNERM